VSPATAGQLLDDLQRQAWDLAAALPERRYERRETASQTATGHLAGWPRLAQMGLHALRAVPLSPGGQHHLALLTPALERVAGRPVKGIADPRVARMADLLGAVGDLLDDEPAAFGPDERDALAVRAKILAGIETAGRSTLGFLEQAPKSVDMSSRWRAELGKVVDEAHRSMRVPAGERQGRYDDVAAVTLGDPTLAGVIARWKTATAAALTPEAGAASSWGVQMAARDFRLLAMSSAVLVRGAGHLGVIDQGVGTAASAALEAASEGWREAAASWPPHIRSGGRASEDQATASMGLRDSLKDLMRDGDKWATPEDIATRLEPLVALADVRRGATAAERLGNAYQSCISSLVYSEALTIAARAVQRTEAAQPTELLAAVRRGHWVPLPATQPAATNLTAAAAAAVELTRDARLAVDVTSRGPAHQLAIGETAPSALKRVTARVRARVAAKPEPSIQSERETENLPGHLPGFTRPAAEVARDETALEKLPARGRSPAQVDLGDLRARVSSLTERPPSPAVPAQPKVQRRGPQL
jgi:hypothetical protein